jgi:hypothetical protein
LFHKFTYFTFTKLCLHIIVKLNDTTRLTRIAFFVLLTLLSLVPEIKGNNFQLFWLLLLVCTFIFQVIFFNCYLLSIFNIYQLMTMIYERFVSLLSYTYSLHLPHIHQNPLNLIISQFLIIMIIFKLHYNLFNYCSQRRPIVHYVVFCTAFWVFFPEVNNCLNFSFA